MNEDDLQPLQKKGPGRPRKYSPERAVEIVALAADLKGKGMSLSGISKEIGISRANLWRLMNPEKSDGVDQRASSLKSKYDITSEKFDEMLAEQGGMCGICEYRGALYVDHDHMNGKIRGLLCQRCNSAIGHVQDDVRVLARAIDYLLKPRPDAPLARKWRLQREKQ